MNNKHIGGLNNGRIVYFGKKNKKKLLYIWVKNHLSLPKAFLACERDQNETELSQVRIFGKISNLGQIFFTCVNRLRSQITISETSESNSCRSTSQPFW